MQGKILILIHEEVSEPSKFSYSAFTTRLPGEEFVHEGLRDLVAGRETIPALLVAIGAPRLRLLGIDVPAHTITTPEHRLHALLADEDRASAHSRYNALIRRLVSFERAY